MSDLLDTRVDTREAIDELAVPKVKPVRKFAPVYAPNDTREAIDPNVSPYEVPLGAAPDVRLRAQKQLADVQALYKIADIQGALDPKTGEKERQKIGVSLFLSSQLNMDARDIYRSFAGDYSPIAADYFKSTDIPYSYWDRAKVVWESTIVQSQVNLLASKMYLSGWNEETNKEIVKLLKSSPYVPPRDKGLIGWAKDAPLELIRQGYSLFTMGGASAAGAAVGGSIGSAFGPGGTAVGTVAGRMIGTMISATAVEAADIYQQTLYSRVIDPETGEEKYAYELVNDPAAFAKIAAASAAIPALLIGAANTLGWEAILGKLPFPKFISNVLEKGALKGLYATSVGKFMATYGKNITTEMLTESFESIMEQKGVDAAVRKANKEFGSRIPESDINTYVNLIRQTMDSVAKLSIFLALPGSIGETARGLQADYVERGMTPEIQKKIDELARISTPAVVEPKANLYKTESGDLYSVQRETRTEADGSKRIMLKYGDPMVEGDNRYGHAVVIEKAGQVIIEEVVSEKDYNVEPQIIKQIAADHVGQEIIWEPQTEGDAAIKETLINQNPRGKEFGLQYNDAKVTLDRFVEAEAEKFRIEGASKELFRVFTVQLAKGAEEMTDTFLTRRIDERIAVRETAEEFTAAQAARLGIPVEKLAAQAGAGGMASLRGAATYTNAEGKEISALETTRPEYARNIKGLAHAFENADLSTAVHELFHIIERYGLTDQQTKMFEIALGKPRAQWEKGQVETLASGMEVYLVTGQVTDPALRTVFEQIADIMRSIFEKLKINLEENKALPEAAKKAYRSMLAEMDFGPEVAQQVREAAPEQQQAILDKAEEAASIGMPETVGEEFINFQVRPPYAGKKLTVWENNLSDDAHVTYKLLNDVVMLGKVGKGNIFSKYKQVGEWNDIIKTNEKARAAAVAAYKIIPAEVRKEMHLNSNGTITGGDLETDLKMERSFTQRLIDALPLENVSSTLKVYDKSINLSDASMIQAVGGEEYRRALVEEYRKQFRMGTIKTANPSGLRKDTWGALGFIATNEKTGISGDFTTLCPQMFYNRGCWYCYRLAALKTGLNNKLVGQKVWYTGELLRLSREDVLKLNAKGGLRIQSFGDWMDHFSGQFVDMLIDADMLSEKYGVGLQIKVITKEASLVEFVGRLKEQGIGKQMYFNLSADYNLEPAGEIGKSKEYQPLNAKRPFERIDGEAWWKRALSVEEAAAYRTRYPWLNVRIVATDQDEFIRGLRDPKVDVVTGYHGRERRFVRVDVETGETKVEVEPLGDAGMPRFLPSGEIDPAFPGKTKKHQALAKAIYDAGLQDAYRKKTCCITGRCASCVGICGLENRKDAFPIQNATNRDLESVVTNAREALAQNAEGSLAKEGWEAPRTPEQLTVNFQGDKLVNDENEGWLNKSTIVVNQKMQGSMEAAALKAMLLNSGVKADEMHFTGLSDYLDDNAGKQISKQDITAFIDGNRVKVEEVVKGGEPSGVQRDELIRVEKEWASAESLRSKKQTEALAILIEKSNMSGPGRGNFLSELTSVDTRVDRITELLKEAKGYSVEFDWNGLREITWAEQRLSRAADKLRQSYVQPKFASYQLPGGTNYREILFTLPVDETKWKKGFVVLNPNGIGREWFATEAEAKAVSRQHGGWGIWEATGRENAPASGAYKGPHWSELNVLLHIRVNDRVDSKGRRMKFLEEVQSDWHQAGREVGYHGQMAEPAVAVNKYGNVPGVHGRFLWDVTINGATSRWQGENADEAKAAALEGWNRNTAKSGVPSAPLSKTWHEFGFRKLLRMATKNGYDAVGWTTGTQQNDRYSLSKQIKTLQAIKQNKNEYLVRYVPISENGFRELGVYSSEQLPNAIGKEMAQKIVDEFDQRTIDPLAKYHVIATEEYDRINDLRTAYAVNRDRPWTLIGPDGKYQGAFANKENAEERGRDLQEQYGDQVVFEGIDLEVGGSGMIGFYDKILVDYANKLGKRFGVKVEDSDIAAKDVSEAYRKTYPADTNPTPSAILVHSLPITDAMREAAGKGEFSMLFQGNGGNTGFDEWVEMAKPYKSAGEFKAAMDAQYGEDFVEEAETTAVPDDPAWYKRIWDEAHKEKLEETKKYEIEEPVIENEPEYDYANKHKSAEKIDDPVISQRAAKGDFNTEQVEELESKATADEEAGKAQLAYLEAEAQDLLNEMEPNLRRQVVVEERAAAKRMADYEAAVKEGKQAGTAEERARREKEVGAVEVRRQFWEDKTAQAYQSKRDAISKLRKDISTAQALREFAKQTKEGRKKLLKDIMRAPSSAIEFEGYAEEILRLQSGIDPNNRSAHTLYERQRTRDFLASHADAAALISAEKLDLVYAVPANALTVAQLEELSEMVDNLRKLGRLKRSLKLSQNRKIIEQAMAEGLQTALHGHELRNIVGPARPTNLLEKGMLMTWKAPVIAKWLDGGTDGFFTHWLVDEVNDKWNLVQKSKRKRTEPIFKRMEELKITADPLDARILTKGFTFLGRKLDIDGFKFEDGKSPTVQKAMFWYIGTRNELTNRALRFGVHYEEEFMAKGIAMLTPQEIELADMIGEDFNENFPRLREAFINVFNIDLKHEAFYVPMNRVGADYQNRNEAIAADLAGRQGVSKTFKARNPTYERLNISEAHQTGIKDDLFTVWLGAVETQEGFIIEDQLIKQLHTIMETGSVKQALLQQHGSEMNAWMGKYINAIARTDQYAAMTGAERFARKVRGNMAIAWLGFNILSNAKQLTSVFGFLGDAGPLHLANAAMKFAAGQGKSIASGKFFGNSMIEENWEMSELLRNRSISQEFEDVKRMNNTLYKSVIGKIGKISMTSLEVIDRVSVNIGWRAVFDRVMEKNGGDKIAAATAADKALVRSQPSGRVQDMAEMYRSNDTMKMFTMFTSELSSFWNRISFGMVNLPNSIKNGQWTVFVGDLISISMSGVAIAAMSGALHGDDPEKKKKLMFNGLWAQFVDSIPLAGSDISSALQGKWRGGGVKLLPMLDYFIKIPADVKAGDLEKAFTDALKGVGFTVGAPVTAVDRFVQTIQTGDVGRLLNWPKEKE